MSARAQAQEVTRDRIVTAAYDAFMTRWYDDVTVREIAAAAGVALQTVLNHFGTKDALFAAVNDRMVESIVSLRWSVEPGDVAGAIDALVADYEEHGDAILRNLAVEARVPAVRPAIDLGRREHQRWCEELFAAALHGLRGAVRERRVAQLVVATDVYTWKLLRRDKALDREQTTTAMRELVLALHDTEGGSER